MKRSFPLTGYCLLFLSIFLSCTGLWHHDNDISISMSESDGLFKMSADFNKYKNNKVLEYIDRRLGQPNNFHFANTGTDATIILEDQTRFYIKSSPGDLVIKINKEENSTKSYAKIKTMCQDLKTIIEDK